jgi:hypothetical protein
MLRIHILGIPPVYFLLFLDGLAWLKKITHGQVNVMIS